MDLRQIKTKTRSILQPYFTKAVPFSPDLETEYQIQLREEKIRLARESSILALVLFLAFGILDIWAIPSALSTAWTVRFTILPVVLVVVFLTTKKQFYLEHYVAITALQYLYYGGAIAIIIYASNIGDVGRTVYYAGLLLVTMALYSWTFLPIRVAASIGLIMAIVYALIAILHQNILQTQSIIFMANCFFLVSANIIGFISYRERDQYFRENYMLRKSLRHSDQMKTQFLSSMSHELRTPLNAIINFNQLIAMGTAGPVTEEQGKMLDIALNSSLHLLQLINDVLDITKIQAGKLILYVEEDVNLSDEIGTVLGIAQPLLEKQNALLEQSVRFLQEIDDDLPLIRCDRRRVRQILLNLLSNAIKFTEKGSITLRAKIKEREILFEVTDTGPGIPENLQAQIFEPFVQTMDGIKHAQGSGLGLPISHNLVQAHGGDLWMQSRVGEGSSFFFTLPLCP